MYYSEDIVEEVRQRNDIVGVISSYVKLQRAGSNYKGLCPFHNEKTPSFSVSPGKQMYHCFGCGVGGNVFTFVMEYENFTFVEAIRYLAERSGMDLPQVEATEDAKRQADLKSRLFEINRIAAKYFYYQLQSERGKAVCEYFSRRGLTEQTIGKFGLGYSNVFQDDLYQYLKKQGYDDELLKQSGLVTLDEKRGAHDKFWNRAMFPIMDVNNKVIAFGGRVLGEGMPKYLNSPETKLFDKSRNLYGLNFARQSRKSFIILCEGYMDVIALHQAGFTHAVASLGTALTEAQASLLKRYTEEVLITYDSDGAGVKAALRAIPILKDAGLSVKIVNLQPYKDPDEFIKGLGDEEFEKRLNQAMNSFYFEIEVLEQDYDFADPEQKTKFFNEVAKKLLIFTEELERNNYIEAIAKRYQITFDNLRKLVYRHSAHLSSAAIKERYTKESIKQKTKNADTGIKQSQKILLTWLIEDPRLFEILNGIISEDDFIEPLYHKVASLLFAQYKQSFTVMPAKIINLFESVEEQNEVASMLNTNIWDPLTTAEQEKAFNETVRRVKKNSLDHASRTVTDFAKLQEIIKAQSNLQKLHISLNRG